MPNPLVDVAAVLVYKKDEKNGNSGGETWRR